jgi:hypothetical protein
MLAVSATAMADADQATQQPRPRDSGPTVFARVDLAGVHPQPGVAVAGAPVRSAPVSIPLDLKRLIHRVVVGQ